MPRFRIDFRAPRNFFNTFILPSRPETRREIVEAKTLREAEEIGRLKLGNYPKDWTVSVEELAT